MPDVAPPSSTSNLNLDLEALRGFAAVFVVWHHISVFGYLLDPGYRQAYPLAYGPSGHFCVLIFFVLSGYVIGLSNQKPLTWATSGIYLKKRVVRLYPIFFFTLVLALVVSPHKYGVGAIVGNLAMVQGLAVRGVNPPGWSLHYEMLYYLLFIGMSIFQVRPLLVVGLALVVGFGNYVLYPVLHAPIISSYCYGLSFWALGVFLSQRLRRAAPEKVARQVLLSCLLFMLCIDQYNLLGTLLRQYVHIGFPSDVQWDQLAIEFYDLGAIPVALLIVLVFIGKQVLHKLLIMKILFVGLALPKLVYVGLHAYRGDLNWGLYGLPTVFLLASLLCLFVRSAWLEWVGQQAVQVGSRLGALSYAIYLVHFPLLYLFSRINFFLGSLGTFAGRVMLLLGAVLVLSYWLEKVVQPRLKAFFFPASPGSQAAPYPTVEKALP